MESEVPINREGASPISSLPLQREVPINFLTFHFDFFLTLPLLSASASFNPFSTTTLFPPLFTRCHWSRLNSIQPLQKD